MTDYDMGGISSLLAWIFRTVGHTYPPLNVNDDLKKIKETSRTVDRLAHDVALIEMELRKNANNVR